MNRLQTKLLEQLLFEVLQTKELMVSRAEMIDEGMHSLVSGINKLEFARVECGDLRERYAELERDHQKLERLRQL